MARIRTIKPEFWRSPDIMQLSIFERLLFIGLWNLADDEGRGVFDPNAIAADLFLAEYSLNAHGVLTDVSNAFCEYQKRDMVHVYEVENRQFFQISHWKDHQTVNRATKSKIPPLTSGNEISFHKHEDSLNTHGALTPGTGNREQGTGNMNNSCPTAVGRASGNPKSGDPKPRKYSPEFQRFWKIYPRREHKAKAATRFEQACKRATVEEIIAGAQEYAAWCERNAVERKFIKLAEGWLSADAWEDELQDYQQQRPLENTFENWLGPQNLVETAQLPAYEWPKEIS